ncbi:YwhD family protein [Jeotgalibacillus sp. ET6]|uniref:YwhD family protein n=1 Tax=Jeotgalibacillus sp. ET6 TaxID=3037260 RepID=UPI00241852D2|nr:YwhD family protein [Jeotgalibacillus sp. ET6]MDG5471116.1 YwhD family protein [Jeotgalibacillus sp. ET6]
MTEKKKKNIGFNIIKNDPTDGHGGFGIGALSLDNVSPVIVDVNEGEAEIDVGAMHARSKAEKGVKFTQNREDSKGGKPYWLVWVTIDRKQEGPFYAGVTACEMVVNREKRRGYKLLPEHVNLMDKSMKRKIVVDKMDDKSKKILSEFLKAHNEEMWKHSDPALHEALQTN